MKVETLTIENWQEKEIGLLIAENEHWILVKHIPVDYVIDGYKLYNKRFIEERESNEETALIEKVLKLKGVKTTAPDSFEFDDVIKTLEWCEDTYGLFEFQDEETELFYGQLTEVNKDEDYFIIKTIKSDGGIEDEEEYEFSTNEVKVITFETDYFTSVALLMKDQNANRLAQV